MKRNVRRIGIFIFIFLCILATTGFIAVRWYLDPYVKNALQQGVNQGSKGLYQLSIQQVSVNLLGASVRAYGIVLNTDTARLTLLRNENPPRMPVKITLTADYAAVLHIHWWKYWKTRQLDIHRIELESPSMEIATVKDTVAQSDTIQAGLLERLPQLLAPNMAALNIDMVKIQHGRFMLRAMRLGIENLQSADHIDVNLAHVHISSLDSSTNKKALYSENMLVELQNYRLWTVGGRYLFSIDAARLVAEQGKIDIRDCVLRSVSSDSITQAESPYRRPRYNFSIPSLSLEGLDVFQAIHGNAILIRRLQVDSATVGILINKNMPLERWRKMPNEVWQKIPFPLSIDSISAKNANIYCKEQFEGDQKTFTFLDAHLLALNLSNDSFRMTDTTPVKIFAVAQFMGAGELSTALSIPLLSPNFFCSFRAVLRDMPLDRINALIDNSNNLRIDEGFATKIDVTAQATSRWTRGKIKVYYNGLKVSVLKDNSSEKKPLASVLANMVIRKDSEDTKEDLPYREEAIDYPRPAEDGFIRMLLQATKGALIKTMTTIKMPSKKKDGKPVSPK